jgi:hypothetical protein
MYCDHCDRSVVALPAGRAQPDRRGLFGAVQRRRRDAAAWRCPDCFGSVHEGDGQLVARGKLDWLAKPLEVVALVAFAQILGASGPAAWLSAIGFVAVTTAAGRAFGPTPSSGEARPPYAPPPPLASAEWIDDARAAYGRGTHITTLAVRYGVEPEWLEDQLRASAGGAR